MKVVTKVPEDRPWFKSKYWPKNVPHQLTYDDKMTCYGLLEKAASESPDWNAIWFLESYVTYAQLKDYVDRFASGLIKLGVKRNDVVALVMPNCIQYVVAFYATIKIGAVVTGVNPTYKSGEVLHQLHETGTKYLVVLDSLNAEMVEPIRAKAELKAVIATNVADLATGISPIKKMLGKAIGKIPKGKVPDSHKFLELLKSPPNSEKADVTLDDPAVYMMTGGTTGVPKAAILTHGNIYLNALQCLIWLLNQKDEGDTQSVGPKTGMVGVLPLFHSFAMTTVMNSSIACKGWMMLFPRPPPTEELLEHFNVIPAPNGLIYCAAEVLFQRIADMPDIEPYREGIKKLKLCISGAGPLHRPIQERFESRTGSKITEGYGLAEASPVVSAGGFYGERKIGSIGLPFPGTDWAIFPSTNFEAGPMKATGEDNTGEICVVGGQIMKGYLNRPEATAETIKKWDGKMWLLTGDIGFMDTDGMICIRDRKKQLIKVRGYSVFPKEVEELVGMHPEVLEVAVAGIPDPEEGELVKAWVKIKDGSTLTTDALKAWCKENMTHYKVPKEIEFRAEIPKSMVGKVMRRVLQEEDPRYQAAMKKK
jgi:long-chain acyl-CoA synthetase